jgi:hypothetical protein
VATGILAGLPTLLAEAHEASGRRVEERVLEAARAGVDDEDPH